MSNQIEDLFKQNDISEFMSKDNVPIYKDIIYDLVAFVNKLKSTYKPSKIKNFVNKKINMLNKEYKNIKISKPLLVYTYKLMIEANDLEEDSYFLSLIRKVSVRTDSGVASFAIMLAPYPEYIDSETGKIIKQEFSCKHNCYFCPAEPDMPRSYIDDEPAVRRGANNNWLPDKQLDNRLASLSYLGHKLSKIELILEGGTYTEYPEQYLLDFHTKLFYTANTWFDKEPKRDMLDIQEEMNINKSAQIRIIGVCIETRADSIIGSDGEVSEEGLKWLRFFRKTGTTRVQIGAQHVDSLVLKKCNRGHDYNCSYQAAKVLQDNCFKTDGQFMPDLPYSSVEKDKEMFDTIVEDGVWDCIKVYPFAVTNWTVFQDQIIKGKLRLYSQDDPEAVFEVMKYGILALPYHMRIARAQRDIPSHHIQYGNNVSNIRQLVEDKIKQEGKFIREIRSREIARNIDYTLEDKKYFIDQYEAGCGTNYFIECASEDRKACFGFIRLRITKNQYFKELKKMGLIRELHVYNYVKDFNDKTSSSTQHTGIGKTLIKMAEYISKQHKMNGIAVISGEGVRDYYIKNGYYEGEYYLLKVFKSKISVFLGVFLGYLFIIMFMILLVQTL
jgi:ELP3 family radical SAM enzyme/protein acetyltransferase